MIGLPSLQTLDGAQTQRIWLAAEATDIRCGFDRLAERVREPQPVAVMKSICSSISLSC